MSLPMDVFSGTLDGMLVALFKAGKTETNVKYIFVSDKMYLSLTAFFHTQYFYAYPIYKYGKVI